MSVKLSDEQAKSLGIAEHIPKRVVRTTGKNEKGQNKTEAAFDRHLADIKYRGGIKEYWFEAVKFRLAGRCYYTPDFYVIRDDDLHLCYEVKGFWRDDARVKFKVAAEKFPHIHWVAVRRINGEWEYELIGGKVS